MRNINKTENGFQKISDYAGISFLCALVIAVAIQVFFRYILNNPLPWPEELARYLFIWITYMGLVKVVRENSHYRIDFFMMRMPKQIQILLEVFFDILIILSLLFSLYGSFYLIKANLVILSPAMQVPLIIMYLAFPVSILFMVPQYFIFIIKNIREIKSFFF